MEKRSSIKDSALRSLFSVTEAAGRADEEPVQSGAADATPEAVPPREREEPDESEAAAPGGAEAGPVGADDEAVGAPVRKDEGRRSLIQPSRSPFAVIRVAGVGGAGTNAINRMLEAGLQGVEFIAINTDAQALAMCEADHKLRIGRELTKGLGGGSDPKVGRDAAMTAYEEIKSVLKGSDMVFITAGEGGGTGTGAAPVVAEIARSIGALTIGVVTFPFLFEGKRRGMQALDGVRALKQRADTVIVVPNQKLLEVSDKGTTMVDALRLADDVLRQGVQGVCDLVTVPGLINLDLADVRTVMMGAGTAHMGIGRARGEQRAQKAAEMALKSSLLDTSIQGARGILLNISGGKDMTLHEITEVAEAISSAAEPDATLIFGAVVNESLSDSLWVTVVAAGFDSTSDEMLAAQVEGVTRPARPAESQPAEKQAALPSYGEVTWEGTKETSRETPRETSRETPRETSRETPKEPRTTPRWKDDDLDVPSFLR